MTPVPRYRFETIAGQLELLERTASGADVSFGAVTPDGVAALLETIADQRRELTTTRQLLAESQAAGRTAVVTWIRGEFRQRLNHDPTVIDMATAVLEVGRHRGDPPGDVLRRTIASAVLQIAGLDPNAPEASDATAHD